MKDYKRFLLPVLQKSLSISRVVLLTGARQTGKTTLLQEFPNSEYVYRTLDDPVLYDVAKDDPITFLQDTSKKIIIDEVQRVPTLLPVIKMSVDKSREKGQFILSGSADVTALPDAQESLAGRIQKVRLRSLTQGEIEHLPPSSFLDQALSGEGFGHDDNLTKGDVLKRAMRGGYPEALQLSDDDRDAWYRGYVDAIMTRDLQDILQIKRFDVMRSLFTVLSSWSSKEMYISTIASSLSVSRKTIDTYINVLSLMYMCDRLQPWLETDYERIAKHDKIFMADCGLMASMLDWDYDQLEFDADKSGKLIETFVYNELAALCDLSGGEYVLYHYRDRNQREIDFVIKHRKSGNIIAIEVKAGSTPQKKAFKHIKWLEENLAKDRKVQGIVLYTGKNYIRCSENMHMVPMSALWSTNHEGSE